MRKLWPLIVVIIVIVAVAAIALGNKDNKNAATPPAAPNPTSSKESTNSNQNPPTSNNEFSSAKSVSIVNMSYSPADITVKKGTTVTWTNNDTIAHTVTADSNNTFDSGNMDKGKTFSFTFNNAGTFAYHCTYHADMHGKVVVTE
jgi:amicyanin